MIGLNANRPQDQYYCNTTRPPRVNLPPFSVTVTSPLKPAMFATEPSIAILILTAAATASALSHRFGRIIANYPITSSTAPYDVYRMSADRSRRLAYWKCSY